ncbi:MAG: phage tail assembly chaperone [Novosphingobium sp.]|nr:phage tail assembly chaperone [Novosphingobium sp.]
MSASAIRTVTLVNLETGAFGPVISGAEADIAPMLSAPYIDGAFDAMTQRLDIETGEIVAAAPRAPLLHELRQQRNEMLDAWRWTVMPDSPLSESSKAAWLAWLRALQAVLQDVTPEQTAGFAFPDQPALIYAEGGAE